MKKYFVIDFDSTFVQSEGLEEYAEVLLKNRSDKESILQKIKTITNLGMEGRISQEESLRRRLKLLKGNRLHIEQVVKILKKKVSTSIKRNRNFFKKFKNNIYIVSGGFKEFILPIVKTYGIDKNHVFANTFILDQKGKVTGLDFTNPLAKTKGKVKIIKQLELPGEIIVIGDGYTDYEIKMMGVAKHFVAFTENVYREVVVKGADQEVSSFDEFLYINKLPMSISYPKSLIKVLLLESVSQEAVVNFEKEGYKVEYHKKSIATDELIDKLKDIKILGIRSRTNLNQTVLNAGHKLLTIGAFCIGTNQIELRPATKNGIVIFNAPYSNTRSVVEMILGEMIMLSREIFNKSMDLHKGIWNKSSAGSFELRGKNLGIIGYGNIGSQLSVLAEALGLNVYFYDLQEKLALGNAKKCKNLKELLRISDIVTIHVDGRDNNKNLINEKEFNFMKRGVLILNASRGYVVNIPALVLNIRSGKVRGAAIDVFPKEPKHNEEKFYSELQDLPNVILTPHIGGSTLEAQRDIAEFVSGKIIDYINKGNTSLAVNFPNLNLPAQRKSHRLLHIHKNVPGMLAKINGILARYKINIEEQYLKTNEDIGYVITDVNKSYDQRIFSELKKIENTIRFRVLF